MAISMISFKAILLIYSLLALCQLATSTDHIVGGQDGGWDIGVDILSWAQGQQFNVGDTLTFKYQAYHDVLEVSKQNYETCTTTNAFSRYTGGSTTIDLKAPGSRYFICGVPRHCNIGMKLEVNVVSSTYPSPPPPSTNDSPPPPVASPPPPPPPVASPPPPATPTAEYSSPAPPVDSVPPPPSPTYYSSPPPTPTADYTSPAPPVVSASPPPSTTDHPSQPPPSPEMPTPTYTDTPPTVAAPPTTTGCDHTPVTPPNPLTAPAPAPKRPKHKKPHRKHGKAPRHAPAPAPNAYKLSKNYVSREQGSMLVASSAAPYMNQLGKFGVISVLTVLMLWVL